MLREPSRSLRWTVLVGLLVLLRPAPLRADLVIPSDFDVLRSYSFSRCELFGFIDVTQPQPYPSTYATSCIRGLASFGLNTDTQLYGVTYDFWTTLSAPPPGDASVLARMCGFTLDGFTDTGSPTFVTVGGRAETYCPGLTSGVAYSPSWTSTSSIVETSALFVGRQDSRLAETVDDRFGAVTVTAIPEPSTLALLGAGLMMLVGVRRASIRRAHRHV